VANFEYMVDVEPADDNESSAPSLKKTNYCEELLRERYQQHKVEELNALGKGKRTRTKLLVYHAGFYAANKY